MSSPEPAALAGLGVSIAGDGRAVTLARKLLRSLGATDGHDAMVALRGEPEEWPGLPAGTLEVAAAYLTAAGALLAALTGSPVEIRRDEATACVLLPELVALLHGQPEPPPAEPIAFAGGWVAAELGGDADRERFEVLLEVARDAGMDVDGLVAEAQLWRLPVLPYSQLVETGSGPPISAVVVGERPPLAAPAAGRAPLDGVTICDLTAMWAGPAATEAAAALGATVVKVEPSVRPDGLRAHGGHSAAAPSPFFCALNGRKSRADLDLRSPDDRRRFNELLAESDVFVESLSPRARRNLGLEPADLRRHYPTLATASLKAFPAGPRREWVGFGTGVHAALGLGGDEPAAPLVSYPDPLAGLALLVGLLAQVRAARLGLVVDVEATLAGAATPLSSPVDQISLVAQ